MKKPASQMELYRHPQVAKGTRAVAKVTRSVLNDGFKRRSFLLGLLGGTAAALAAGCDPPLLRFSPRPAQLARFVSPRSSPAKT